MDKIKIVVLTDKNSPYIDVISNWMYEWWGKEDGWSVDKVRFYIKNCISENSVPQTIIALNDDKIVGVCQLLMQDLDSRPDIYPWLANLFVDINYRGQGIAGLLIKKAIERSKINGLKTLYLYTKHINLYEKFGWVFVENVETFKKHSPIEKLYRLDLW